MARLTEIGWDSFVTLPLEAKRSYLEREGGGGMPYHTLFAQQFDRPLLERLAALANRIRFIAKSREGVYKVPRCKMLELPLGIYEDFSAFKLYLSGVGLSGAVVGVVWGGVGVMSGFLWE